MRALRRVVRASVCHFNFLSPSRFEVELTPEAEPEPRVSWTSSWGLERTFAQRAYWDPPGARLHGIGRDLARAADATTRVRFAGDLDKLTLASPKVNRYQKSGKDAGEWMPAKNKCWFAARVVTVRQKYRLTIDAREAAALDAVLAGCASTDLVVYAPSAAITVPAAQTEEGTIDALARWDDNGNGRIACAEARAHGIAPVPRGHSAYPFMRDGDGDGVMCE